VSEDVVMAKSKKWVAIKYSLPSAGRSAAHKRLFGYKWKERKTVHLRKARHIEGRNVQATRVLGEAAELVFAAEHQPVVHLMNPGHPHVTHRVYERRIPSDLEGIPYSRLGNGVILVPLSHSAKAVKIFRSRGCRVNVGTAMSGQEQYQASNAYFLGQWQSYLSALDGLLANVVEDNQAIMSLTAARRLSERFLEDVRNLPVASVPEDIEALSMKAKVVEVLNAYSSGSESRVSLLESFRKDVEAQLKVLREQGQAVLAAL